MVTRLNFIRCDLCGTPFVGAESPISREPTKAQRAMYSEHGWHIWNNSYDLCPKCWEKTDQPDKTRAQLFYELKS